MSPNATEIFDVFLCHNSADKPAVRELSKRLMGRGLKPWLDEDQLRPGLPWQRALEENIGRVKSVAVFVGCNGIGPWQEMEQDAFLREFVQRKCPVIPVLLPDASDQPELPLFLKGFMWVDQRRAELDPFKQLVWGITGIKPADQPEIFDTTTLHPSVDFDAPESTFHIEWPFEKTVRRLLESSGATVTLKGHAKVGLTALLIRLHRWGIERPNCISCYLNFHAIGSDQFADTNKLLRAIADEMSNEFDSQFDVLINVDDHWNLKQTAQRNLTRFVEAVMDGVPDKEVQILLDDVDLAFEHGQPATDFFKLLRSWHEKRPADMKGRWKRFDLVIAHSTEPTLWIDDANHSPFNVGKAFELEDFEASQVAELNAKYCEPIAPEKVGELMELVGGHPYLLRLAFYWLATRRGKLDNMKAIAANDDGPFGDVLHYLSRRILTENTKRVRTALKAVIARGVFDSGHTEDELLFQKCCTAGLLTGPDRNHCKFRNEIYRQYFEPRL